MVLLGFEVFEGGLLLWLKTKRIYCILRAQLCVGFMISMINWQNDNQKRLLSLSIQKDGTVFCCIALTNPTEVFIQSGDNNYQAKVTSDGFLRVRQG